MALITYSSGSGNSVSAISGTATSTTNSWTHTAASGTNQLAVVVGSITGNSTDAAISASYGGTAMTQLQVYNWGNAARIAVFALPRIASGNQTVSVTFSSLNSGIPARQTSAVVAVYNGAGRGEWVTSSNATSTSASVTTTGLIPSDYAVFAHAHSTAADYSSYNRTQRVTTAATSFNRLTLGDATGNTGSLTSTATLASSDDVTSLAIDVHRQARQEFFA